MSREEILSEIKQIAKQRNGSPPGRELFAKLTGIKPYHWSAFWARWSDALRDAGFASNELISGYSDQTLFGHLVNLIRKLGHFPSALEIRFEAANVEGFPSKSTFENRGAKAELVSKVIEFCGNDPEFSDVVAICRSAIQTIDRSETKQKMEKLAVEGVVYLAKAGRFYKIGRSSAPGRREAELSLRLPQPCKIIHEIKTDDPVGIESYWHKRFDAKRKNGEWFDLDKTEIAAFRRRTFM
jgi:hypothetical protein